MEQCCVQHRTGHGAGRVEAMAITPARTMRLTDADRQSRRGLWIEPGVSAIAEPHRLDSGMRNRRASVLDWGWQRCVRRRSAQ